MSIVQLVFIVLLSNWNWNVHWKLNTLLKINFLNQVESNPRFANEPLRRFCARHSINMVGDVMVMVIWKQTTLDHLTNANTGGLLSIWVTRPSLGGKGFFFSEILSLIVWWKYLISSCPIFYLSLNLWNLLRNSNGPQPKLSSGYYSQLYLHICEFVFVYLYLCICIIWA